MSVDIVHWNPRRPLFPGIVGKLVPVRRRVNNFGDVLGPVLVRKMCQGLDLREPVEARRLLSVGSIMKLSRPGDVVWGTGVNGKSRDLGGGSELDIRAVRGPRSRALLLEGGATVPKVYGDPALLWPALWSRRSYGIESEVGRAVFVPNFHDLGKIASEVEVISPIGEPHSVIRKLLAADFVCASSLHAVILAEAFGIPARLVVPGEEPLFKYADYYEATGRTNFKPANSVSEALDMGGEEPLQWDPTALTEAFPADLWLTS